MFPLPEKIIAFLVQSAGLLSTTVRDYAQVMVIGAPTKLDLGSVPDLDFTPKPRIHTD